MSTLSNFSILVHQITLHQQLFGIYIHVEIYTQGSTFNCIYEIIAIRMCKLSQMYHRITL